MNWLKASIVIFLALSLSLWSASQGWLPLGDQVQDVALGVVGVIGLSLAAAFRAIIAVLAPLSIVLRVLALPILLGGIAYLVFAALKGRQSGR